MKKRLISDINHCEKTGFSNGEKKLYSGSIGVWIPLEYEDDKTANDKGYKSFEFGFKQTPYAYENGEYLYNFSDYNSAFLVFRLQICNNYYNRYTKSNINGIRLLLKSTDDGEFEYWFDNRYLNEIMKFFEQNYKSNNFGDLLRKFCEDKSKF